MKSNWLSVQQAADILGVSRATLYRYVCLKQVPHVRIYGRILFDEERLQKFVDEHSFEPIADR